MFPVSNKYHSQGLAMRANSAINSGSEKRRPFVASLFTAGYGER